MMMNLRSTFETLLTATRTLDVSACNRYIKFFPSFDHRRAFFDIRPLIQNINYIYSFQRKFELIKFQEEYHLIYDYGLIDILDLMNHVFLNKDKAAARVVASILLFEKALQHNLSHKKRNYHRTFSVNSKDLISLKRMVGGENRLILLIQELYLMLHEVSHVIDDSKIYSFAREEAILSLFYATRLGTNINRFLNDESISAILSELRHDVWAFINTHLVAQTVFKCDKSVISLAIEMLQLNILMIEFANLHVEFSKTSENRRQHGQRYTAPPDLYFSIFDLKAVKGLPGEGQMLWQKKPIQKETIIHVLENLFCGEGLFNGRDFELEKVQIERRKLQQYLEREVIIRVKRYDTCRWVDYLWGELVKTSSLEVLDRSKRISMNLREEDIMSNYTDIFLNAILSVDKDAKNAIEKSSHIEGDLKWVWEANLK